MSIMSPSQVFFTVVAGAVVTYFLRAVSFLVFSGNRKMPDSLSRLGKILPNAVMAVLVVYCLKDVTTDFYAIGIPKFLAVFVVAISYKIKHSTFWSILLGTISYMLFIAVF